MNAINITPEYCACRIAQGGSENCPDPPSNEARAVPADYNTRPRPPLGLLGRPARSTEHRAQPDSTSTTASTASMAHQGGQMIAVASHAVEDDSLKCHAVRGVFALTSSITSALGLQSIVPHLSQHTVRRINGSRAPVVPC